jgi:hypothetical protein
VAKAGVAEKWPTVLAFGHRVRQQWALRQAFIRAASIEESFHDEIGGLC